MNNKNLNSKKKNSKNKLAKKIAKSPKNSNVVKLNTYFNTQNLIHFKKLKAIFIIIVILILALLIRIGILQFVDGNSLKESAYKQQTINQIISPKRGKIYASTGEALAISARVDTITINPQKIVDENKDEEKTKALKEKVAKGLSEIFELNYEDVLEKVTSDSQFQTIAKKVDQDKVTKLKEWMKKNKVTVGINIDEDSKRYYPYETICSSILGFCGTDNQGITGIESKWDSVLTGTPGKIVSSKGSDQKEIPDSEETYIAAENGSDLTLTIDFNIQSIVERYLKQAVEENNCENGGNVIVMNPKNGDILAMASYPNYNLNTPFTPNETLAKTYDSLSSEEKNEAIQNMWKNKSVSDLYEPGSTFKVITSSIAIEENITSPDNEGEFVCTGYEHVADRNIACWRYYNPHGYQSLRKALENSCNPAFIQLSRKIGIPTTYKYYRAFGLFEKTGVALAGEENSIVRAEKNATAVDLATMSFGQRLSITPLQMITAISAVANDGYLMQPRIVDKIVDPNTGSTTVPDTVQVRQVVSKKTAAEVMDMLDYAVSDGTGKYADVKGYSIGGKSGTSENLGQGDGTYVASFIGLSPTVNTQVVVLVALYNPKGKSFQGGEIAGPVVSQILSEVLPYIGVASTTNDSSSKYETTTMPDLKNKTILEAKELLQASGFDVHIDSSIQDTELVANQMPKKGAQLLENADVFLYTESSNVSTSVSVPNFKGMSVSEAINVASEANLNIAIDGSGIVISQDIAADSQVEIGSVINLTLKSQLNGGW